MIKLKESCDVNYIASLKNEIKLYYNQLENDFSPKIVNLNQFKTPVNFKEAKSIPIHNWFTYKEGFSPNFVKDFILRFKENDNPVIFDPFGGIGTTVLESSLLGFIGYSNDINPLSLFISRVKCSSYSEEDLKVIKHHVNSLITSCLKEIATAPRNETVLNYFEKDTLNNILKIKYWILEINEDKIRNVFLLSLLTVLESISTHKKDGNGVKRKKNFKGIFSLKEIVELIVDRMNSIIIDIESNSLLHEGNIFHQSSFNNYVLPQKADIVITSPPYANCFDYSKIYLLELWFGDFFKEKNDQKKFREDSIISHVHYTWKRELKYEGSIVINTLVTDYLNSFNLWNKNIPKMLSSYFKDMENVLLKLIPNLNNNSVVGIVVGNSVYSGLVIPTDLLLSEIAKKLGFIVEGIEVYRYLSPSSQQIKMIEDSDKLYLRESLVVLKWKGI